MTERSWSRPASVRLVSDSGVLLLTLDVRQHDRLDAVVLEHDRPVFLVSRNAGADGHLAFALAVWRDPELDHGVRIVQRARAALRFPEGDGAVGHDGDAFGAVRG